MLPYMGLRIAHNQEERNLVHTEIIAMMDVCNVSHKGLDEELLGVEEVYMVTMFQTGHAQPARAAGGAPQGEGRRAALAVARGGGPHRADPATMLMLAPVDGAGGFQRAGHLGGARAHGQAVLRDGALAAAGGADQRARGDGVGQRPGRHALERKPGPR